MKLQVDSWKAATKAGESPKMMATFYYVLLRQWWKQTEDIEPISYHSAESAKQCIEPILWIFEIPFWIELWEAIAMKPITIGMNTEINLKLMVFLYVFLVLTYI